MLINTNRGLYCPAGDFYIDPLRSVPKAIITHAHSDHARRGMEAYLCHRETTPLLRARLGGNNHISDVEYNEPLTINGVRVSLHPAGHVAGSAQVRVEHKGEVWVASGDYKREADPFAQSFEPVRCHVFITESTFGLPVYRWPQQNATFQKINSWWLSNADAHIPSVIHAYSLGKAQHILGLVDLSIGPVYVHPAVMTMNDAMSAAGHHIPNTSLLNNFTTKEEAERSLIITPSIADGPDWMQENGAIARGRASGWLAVRRAGRRAPDEMGFVLSDHADWQDLVDTVRETECEHVYVNHGFSRQLSHYLSGIGLQAESMEHMNADTIAQNEGISVSKLHKFLEEHTGFDQWLIDECVRHVGSIAETVALLVPDTTALPTSLRKSMLNKILKYTLPEVEPDRHVARRNEPLATDVARMNAPLAADIARKNAPLAAGDAHIFRTVLMHVHLRTGGRRGFEKFTMGVWSNGVLIPLVHVIPPSNTSLMEEIARHVKHSTIASSGPVRTVAPRFVFDVAVRGAETALRRKSGLSFASADIVNYVTDIQPSEAATLEHILLIVQK
jgi:putative mRNA 3-end processing factor